MSPAVATPQFPSDTEIQDTNPSRENTPLRNWGRLFSGTDPLPLAVFRIGFGLVMAASAIRFLALGWVDTLYVQPEIRFTYFGFGWVPELPSFWLHAIVVATAMLALAIAWGRAYRGVMIAFFLCFTYIELLDATTYLNHYYFVSAVSLLLIVLPLDAALLRNRPPRAVPAWTIRALRLHVGLVYFFAGVAKLNPDWLIEAMPLQIWLPARGGLPIIGPLLDIPWMPWVMSWAGAAFDLLVPFFLTYRPTRRIAYLFAVGFHLSTFFLFNIGVFPFVMLVAALIFFDADELRSLERWLRRPSTQASSSPPRKLVSVKPASAWIPVAVSVLLMIQIVLPLRHWLYPGDRFWTEEGMRFAWHVMVTEKTGTATFHVRDPETEHAWVITPDADLTPNQEAKMSVQPDMIWQYAQHVEHRFQQIGYADVEVRAEVYVSLNGRPSRLLVDPTIDLTHADRSLRPKPWVLRTSSSMP